MAPTGVNATDAMAHGDPEDGAALAGCRALVDGEHHGVALGKGNHIGALMGRMAFGHHELAPGEVFAGP